MKTVRMLGIVVVAVGVVLAAMARPAGADTHYVSPGESIQAVIDDPCTVNGDEIVVAQGIYVGAINFHGKAITLRSTDPNDPSVVAATIIHGAMASSAVTCNSSEDANTILDGFTIMLGQAAAGGGMLNLSSSPTVKNCTFSNNYATDFGAGMANFTNSSPTVTNCTFSSNTAATVGGGGMCNWALSSPTVTNCTFIDNQATNANGGGMYNFSSSPTVTDCNFSGNTAATDGGGMYNNSSSPTVTECSFIGNSAVEGGGMYNIVSSPTVTNCNFSGNTAATDGGGMCNGGSSPTVTECSFAGNAADRGGGMYCDSSSSPTVTDCTFTGNTASSGNHGGGGMYCYDSSPTVTNCTFHSNAADEDGGGIGSYGQDSSPDVTNCLFIENTAGDKGGGMCNSYGTPTVTNCTFSGNSAHYGGGMRNYHSSPTVTSCRFTANSATTGDGGGISNKDNSSPNVVNCVFNLNTAADKGGGICNDNNCDSTVTNCTFSGNSAGGGGGGIRNYNGDPIVTNCILWGNSPDEISNEGGSVTVSYSNVGGGYSGTGNINANPSFVSPAEYDLRLRACSPCVDAGNNSVVTEPNDLGGDPRKVDDAGVDDTGTGTAPIVDMGAYERQEDTLLFNVRNITQDVNYCSIQSAIVYAYPGDVIEVGPGTYDRIVLFTKAITLYSTHGPNVTFIDAGGYGTAVTCLGAPPSSVLEGFTITGGNATNGGGMFNMSSSLTVRNCTFTGNTATTDGGGMCNGGSSPTVTECSFAGNAADRGGGMYCDSSSSPTVTDCTFTGNTASSGNHGGGGMYCYDSSPTVTNCTFHSNAADEDGGGIGSYGQDSSPDVTNCLFIENTAGDKGGGMCNSYGTPTVTNCTFSGNSAGGGGGGIRNYNGDPIVTNCILWADAPDEIYDSGGSTVTYSDVEGGTGETWFGTGCIDADPLFVSPARGDVRLVSYSSPCVDAGNNGVVTEPNDLAGNPRVVDGDQDATERVDIGAYEFNGGPVRNITLDRSYLSIQVAIDDPCTLDSDEIEVAPGTYYEAINFLGKGVRLYSSGGADVTTIDGTGNYHVVQCVSGEDANTILEGFTITGGNANGDVHPHWHGGGMYNESSSPTVTNCVFSGNIASQGGGGMENWLSSPTVTNCIFSGNEADSGGGMNNSGSGPTVTNCTFSSNTASSDGGGMCNGGSSPTVTNCILWNDTPDEIYDDATSTTTVRYSDVQGGRSGEGNIDQNPLLRDVTEGDLSLAPWSPCVDTGNNAVVGPNATDITGLPRLVDGDCNTTVIVDMGAHEFGHTYGGDFDSSCFTNMADFAFLAWAWLATPLSENWYAVCDISTPGDGVIDNKDLKVFAGNWLADVNTPLTCDANRLKEEFGLDAVCAGAILSAAPCGYSPNDVAQALYDAGYSAGGAYQALTQVCGLTDGFPIEQILYSAGYPPEEYLESTALSFVRKFAPVLYFDEGHEGVPMSAQVYFETMMSPRANSPYPGQITWTTPWDGPCWKPGVESLCGRDKCNCGMQNNDFQTLVNGEIPTYYKVISDIDSYVPTGPKGRLRIWYWWFYGFQGPCNLDCPGYFYCHKDGAHHGDWEHIIVTTDPDRTRADSVTYSFHGDWYTRQWGGFPALGDRPVVYVGRVSHGNWHSNENDCLWEGEEWYCCTYADCRTPDENTKWYNAYQNLVSLSGNSEPWMLADRIGSLYEYYGVEYTISAWRWGPKISCCLYETIWGYCANWEHQPACSTHPTTEAFNWTIASCYGEGCGTLICVFPDWGSVSYPDGCYYNQGWPWD